MKKKSLNKMWIVVVGIIIMAVAAVAIMMQQKPSISDQNISGSQTVDEMDALIDELDNNSFKDDFSDLVQ